MKKEMLWYVALWIVVAVILTSGLVRVRAAEKTVFSRFMPAIDLNVGSRDCLMVQFQGECARCHRLKLARARPPGRCPVSHVVKGG